MSPEASESGWRPLAAASRREAAKRAAPPHPATQAFARLAVTHSLSTAGDAMCTVALAGSLFFSISPKAARGHVALSLLFTVLPFAVVAPFLGPAIDRTRRGRRFMMASAAGGRVVAALLMANEVHSLLLFPAALVLLILSKTHAVAKSALVPGAVRSADDLVEANGRLAVLAAIVALAAALPAGGILKLLGAQWVLRAAAIVYVAATVSALRLRPAPPPELAGVMPGAAGAIEPDAPEDAVAGARLADLAEEPALHSGVFLAATAMAVLRGVVGFLTFAVAFDFRRHNAPSWWFGIVLGASTLGNFAGAIVGPRLRTIMKEERMLAGVLWVVAVVALVAGWLGSRWGTTVLAFTVGVGAAAARLAFDAIVQRDGPEAVRGRTFARFEARFQVVWVAAALIPVAVTIPAKVASFVLALATGMAGVYYLTGRRALRRAEPSAAPAGRSSSIAGGTPGPAPARALGPALDSALGPARGTGRIGPGGVRWADDVPPGA